MPRDNNSPQDFIGYMDYNMFSKSLPVGRILRSARGRFQESDDALFAKYLKHVESFIYSDSEEKRAKFLPIYNRLQEWKTANEAKANAEPKEKRSYTKRDKSNNKTNKKIVIDKTYWRTNIDNLYLGQNMPLEEVVKLVSAAIGKSEQTVLTKYREYIREVLRGTVRHFKHHAQLEQRKHELLPRYNDEQARTEMFNDGAKSPKYMNPIEKQEYFRKWTSEAAEQIFSNGRDEKEVLKELSTKYNAGYEGMRTAWRKNSAKVREEWETQRTSPSSTDDSTAQGNTSVPPKQVVAEEGSKPKAPVIPLSSAIRAVPATSASVASLDTVADLMAQLSAAMAVEQQEITALQDSITTHYNTYQSTKVEYLNTLKTLRDAINLARTVAHRAKAKTDSNVAHNGSDTSAKSPYNVDYAKRGGVVQ